MKVEDENIEGENKKFGGRTSVAWKRRASGSRTGSMRIDNL